MRECLQYQSTFLPTGGNIRWQRKRWRRLIHYSPHQRHEVRLRSDLPYGFVAGEKAGRIVSRRIDLHCDDPNAFVGVLPHETTHAVLAGRFGPGRLPHWADEGMAVLSEPRDRIDLHLHNLPQHRSSGELFAVDTTGSMYRVAATHR